MALILIVEDHPANLKLARLILEHCAKPRSESRVLKALEKDVPEATKAERKAAIDRAIEAGTIVESSGSLVAVHPKPVDDGVMPDLAQ